MTDQNSTVVYQIRPDDLMSELGIKKDTYYNYLKFLGLKAEKDHEGKAYLNEEQANALRALRQHIETTGKMDGFLNSNGELAVSQESNILNAAAAQVPQDEPVQPGMEDEIIRMAAELRGQQLVMMPLVVQELASQMRYEDLPADVRAKVDSVRENASPKFQPSQVAANILDKWRNRNQPAAA